MAVDNLKFRADVDEWVKAAPERVLAVFRESTQRVGSMAAEGVPVDTGFARASVQASLSAMPQIDPGAKGSKGSSYDASGSFAEMSLTINNATLSDTIYIGWTANYIQYLEWGHSQQAPAGFVGIAASQWPVIVQRVVAEAKARAG